MSPVEQVCAIGVISGHAMQPLVADEEAPLAVRRAAGRPDELPAAETITAEVAKITALSIADGDANAASGLFLAAADDVEAVILPHGGIHRVVESLALHDRHAHGVGVFQSFRFLCSGHKPHLGVCFQWLPIKGPAPR